MGARGELFTTQVFLDNRSYFFNVKENRTGDVFLQIVESKNRDGAEADRHQIAIFAEDMQKFLQGMEKSADDVKRLSKEAVDILLQMPNRNEFLEELVMSLVERRS